MMMMMMMMIIVMSISGMISMYCDTSNQSINQSSKQARKKARCMMHDSYIHAKQARKWSQFGWFL
jgi:hypothetical protein